MRNTKMEKRRQKSTNRNGSMSRMQLDIIAEFEGGEMGPQAKECM